MNKAKYIKTILYFILVIFIGPLMFVYAGYDDSPGGQLIGLVVVIIGIIGIVKTKKKISHVNKKLQTVNTYNTTASAMAKKFNDIGARVDDIERGFSFLQKNNPKVLEIGCGNGRDAKEILKHTNNYLGIDISEEMIKLAREYVPKGQFKITDIENYKFPNNIDLIFSFASLLHSSKEDVKNILDRAYSALEDSGIFYISLKYAKYHKEDKTDEFGTRTYYFYTPEDIKKLSGDQYKVLYENVQNLQGQKWFTIALQK